MPQHLLLPDPRRLPLRRAGGGGGGTPPRQPGRPRAERLGEQLPVPARAPRRLNLGVDPSLVFKVKAGSRPEDSAFEGRGLHVLGETVDYAYFVLADDQGSAFSAAMKHYMRTGDMRSFFNMIDDIETYGPEDRRGPGVDGHRDVTYGLWRLQHKHLAGEHSGGGAIARRPPSRRSSSAPEGESRCDQSVRAGRICGLRSALMDSTTSWN